MVAPWERFRLAETTPIAPVVAGVVDDPEAAMPGSASRKVGKTGPISFASVRYKAGVWLAGETVDVVCDRGLVHLHHGGVVIATRARRHDLPKQQKGLRRRKRAGTGPRPTPSASAVSVTRKVDSSGNVCFADASYRAGATFKRRQVQGVIIGDQLEISIGTELIRSHPIATIAPANTTHSPTPAVDRAGSTLRTRGEVSGRYRSHSVGRVPGLDKRLRTSNNV